MATTNEDDVPEKHDETIPGGAYIVGGHRRKDGKHYGGRVVDSEGRILNEFEPDQVNDGKPRAKVDPTKKADDKTPPAAPHANPAPAAGK